MTTAAAELEDIEGFLARHEQKELVRFVTVGSVDDGKSTLIGRMLHDAGAVYDDQLRAVRRATRARGAKAGHAGEAAQNADDEDQLDFSLFTDGLLAEREQGITIDVAYRYFSTEHRKFIIADTPGHEQYTRNMATGASTADLAVILLDARLGILPQSRRHATIASLLGISQLVVAVNKMDLVDYAEPRFRELETQFRAFTARLRFTGVSFVPVSAKRGDNVVRVSERMPWYTGESLLGLLSTLPVKREGDGLPLRFPVQTVIRPHLDYRGFAGVIAQGVVRPGDEVVVLPSGRTTTVEGVDVFEGALESAGAPLSVTLRLAEHVDVSRGEMIASASAPPAVATGVEADVVWLSETPFDVHRRLLMKHTTRWVPARITQILGKVSLESAAIEGTTPDGGLSQGIRMNDIARVRLSLSRPIFCDRYVEGRATGAFILVDALNNATVAAGMIAETSSSASARSRRDEDGAHRVDLQERSQRFGHAPAIVRARDQAARFERALFDLGINAIQVDADASVETIARLCEASLVVVLGDLADDAFTEIVRGVAGAASFDVATMAGDAAKHVAAVVTSLNGETGGSGI
ncbi:MAG: GTP-binding protein [Polyangiaceae bacterium]